MASEGWVIKLCGFTDSYKNRCDTTVKLSAAWLKHLEILYNKQKAQWYTLISKILQQLSEITNTTHQVQSTDTLDPKKITLTHRVI